MLGLLGMSWVTACAYGFGEWGVVLGFGEGSASRTLGFGVSRFSVPALGSKPLELVPFVMWLRGSLALGS